MAMIRLYHGSDLASVLDILQNGLDAGKAASYNASGEFWATTEVGIAEWFAKSNPAGNPAIYAFELSEAVIQALLNSAAKAVFAHAGGAGIDYEFLPASFAVVNQHMSGRSVITLP